MTHLKTVVSTDGSTPQRSQKRKRNRNILWFNPLLSSNVKTIIGKKTLREALPKNKYIKAF